MGTGEDQERGRAPWKRGASPWRWSRVGEIRRAKRKKRCPIHVVFLVGPEEEIVIFRMDQRDTRVNLIASQAIQTVFSCSRCKIFHSCNLHWFLAQNYTSKQSFLVHAQGPSILFVVGQLVFKQIKPNTRAFCTDLALHDMASFAPHLKNKASLSKHSLRFTIPCVRSLFLDTKMLLRSKYSY